MRRKWKLPRKVQMWLAERLAPDVVEEARFEISRLRDLNGTTNIILRNWQRAHESIKQQYEQLLNRK